MRLLKLDHWAVRRAVREHNLNQYPRIGRGTFCAVYDKGDTVLKLTCDEKAYWFVRDMQDAGPWFPRLIADHHKVAAMGERDVYLIEVEKLTRIRANSKPWKRVVELGDKLHTQYKSFHNKADLTELDRHRYASVHAFYRMADDDTLDEDTQEAFGRVAQWMSNYECGHDFSAQNVMLRGTQLVFNDVIADTASLLKAGKEYADQQRRLRYMR